MALKLVSHSKPAGPSPEPPVRQLSQGGQLFIWSARQWTRARYAGCCVTCALVAPYKQFDCVAAVNHLHDLMQWLTAAPRRPPELRHPFCPRLSKDEQTLLRVVQAITDPGGAVARAAAARLTTVDGGELCDSARRYRASMAPSGLPFSHYRPLHLAWSAGR